MTDLDLAEVERLLEAPQGLVETVALARVVRPLLSALKAERERAAQVWRSIETAPKDGTTILLYLADEGFSTLGRWRLDADDPSDDGAFWLPAMDEWADTTGETALHHATHWQPLPSPPGDRP